MWTAKLSAIWSCQSVVVGYTSHNSKIGIDLAVVPRVQHLLNAQEHLLNSAQLYAADMYMTCPAQGSSRSAQVVIDLQPTPSLRVHCTIHIQPFVPANFNFINDQATCPMDESSIVTAVCQVQASLTSDPSLHNQLLQHGVSPLELASRGKAKDRVSFLAAPTNLVPSLLLCLGGLRHACSGSDT